MSGNNEKENGDKLNEEKMDVDETVDEDDEDDPIDDEQLEEYRGMVEKLGHFPDKVKINSLSMVAEDHADSKKNAAAIYEVIRQPLMSKNVPSDRKLPLVYVIDSILKNVKGTFIPIIEKDAKNWLPIVHNTLSEDKRAKLKKVWNLWKDAGVFGESSWKEMGKCFSGPGASEPTTSTKTTTTTSQAVDQKLEKAGISWGKDGGLLLMPKLREAMQTILDDLQSDVQDELEKVSLERLATIDAELLIKIKRAAEDSLRKNNSSRAGDTNNKSTQQEEPTGLSILLETRPPEVIERSNTWKKLKIDHLKETRDIIATLQHLVIDISKSDARYTQKEAIDMTNSLAAAGAAASLLTNTLEKIQYTKMKGSSKRDSGIILANSSGLNARGYLSVDKNMFTNQGIKKKNPAVIAMLYEIGLPFVSSSDGRRFATQIELSNHLDALFKRGQLEKTMARTEERGWYVSDSVWSGEPKTGEKGKENLESSEAAGAGAEEDADPATFTMPADESKDRCVICGDNFKMYFDNDDGIYKYRNCREIEVLNDEAAANESDQVFVHVTCWRALGSPAVLNSDQTLQDAMRY